MKFRPIDIYAKENYILIGEEKVIKLDERLILVRKKFIIKEKKYLRKHIPKKACTKKLFFLKGQELIDTRLLIKKINTISVQKIKGIKNLTKSSFVLPSINFKESSDSLNKENNKDLIQIKPKNSIFNIRSNPINMKEDKRNFLVTPIFQTFASVNNLFKKQERMNTASNSNFKIRQENLSELIQKNRTWQTTKFAKKVI